MGLVVFATTVILGVALAGGGDQGHRQASARATTANAMSAGRSRPRTAGAVRPEPSRRDHKARSASRRSSS